jgi:hypothetical protein
MDTTIKLIRNGDNIMEKLNRLSKYLRELGFKKESSAVELILKFSQELDDSFYIDFSEKIIMPEIKDALEHFREDLRAQHVSIYQGGELRRQMGEDPGGTEEYKLTPPSAYAKDSSERIFGQLQEIVAQKTPGMTEEDIKFSTEGIKTITEKLSGLISVFKNYYMGMLMSGGKNEKQEEKSFKFDVAMGIVEELKNIKNELKQELSYGGEEELEDYPDWMYEDDNFEKFDEYLNEGDEE